MADLSPSAVPVNMPSVAEANNHISDVIRLMTPSPNPTDAKATTLHFQDIIVAEVIPRLCAKVGVSVASWKKSQLLPTSASAEREDGNATTTASSSEVADDVESKLLPCNVINVVDADGRTAFHWALSMKRFDVAQALLDAPFNANPLTVDLDGATTLTTACSVDCPSALLSTLLSAAAATAAAVTTASSSSSVAEGGDATSAVDFFNAQDTAGNTPLLYIASRGNTRALKVILAAIPANVFLTYRTVEMKSAAKVFSGTNATPSSAAAGGVAVPTEMAGVTIIKPTATPAPEATVSDVAVAPPVVATPLLNYPDPFALNKRRQTALHRAIARGASDFVEEYLSWMKRRVATNNVDPSKGPNGSDVVSNKASVRHFINSQDVQGNTALHYAALENNQDLGQLLLRNGADRDIRNKDGQEFWKL